MVCEVETDLCRLLLLFNLPRILLLSPPPKNYNFFPAPVKKLMFGFGLIRVLKLVWAVFVFDSGFLDRFVRDFLIFHSAHFSLKSTF